MAIRYYDYANNILVDNTVHWVSDSQIEANSTVYSDRLYQWDSNKFDTLCKQTWGNSGQYFSNREPEDIEKFLSLYLGKKIKLVRITQETNQSNGYPYWRFDYKK